MTTLEDVVNGFLGKSCKSSLRKSMLDALYRLNRDDDVHVQTVSLPCSRCPDLMEANNRLQEENSNLLRELDTTKQYSCPDCERYIDTIDKISMIKTNEIAALTKMYENQLLRLRTEMNYIVDQKEQEMAELHQENKINTLTKQELLENLQGVRNQLENNKKVNEIEKQVQEAKIIEKKYVRPSTSAEKKPLIRSTVRSTAKPLEKKSLPRLSVSKAVRN